jgi:hypothetical protein
MTAATRTVVSLRYYRIQRRELRSHEPAAVPSSIGSMNGRTTASAPSSERAVSSRERRASAAYPRSHSARSGTSKCSGTVRPVGRTPTAAPRTGLPLRPRLR